MKSSKIKSTPKAPRPLHPDFFYPLFTLPDYLGLGVTQIEEKIELKEYPPLVKPSDSGRRVGFYGRMIIAIQAERQAKANAATRKPADKRKVTS
jgi:hypothetical protein